MRYESLPDSPLNYKLSLERGDMISYYLAFNRFGYRLEKNKETVILSITKSFWDYTDNRYSIPFTNPGYRMILAFYLWLLQVTVTYPIKQLTYNAGSDNQLLPKRWGALCIVMGHSGLMIFSENKWMVHSWSTPNSGPSQKLPVGVTSHSGEIHVNVLTTSNMLTSSWSLLFCINWTAASAFFRQQQLI